MAAFVVVLALPGEPEARSNAVVIDALQKPLVLSPLAALVACGVLWVIRGWVLRKRLRDPGPIHLLPLEDGTAAQAVMPGQTVVVLSADGTTPTTPATGAPGSPIQSDPILAGQDGPPIGQLGMHLRQRLSELELTAPTPMPGRPMSTDFVEILSTTKLDFKQPLAVVGKLLRMVRPTHAYSVKATLLRREQKPAFGVSVELTVLVGTQTILRRFWDESWEAALDRSTAAIGAAIVPLSRQSEQGPWRSWRGREIDERLFGHYQRFQKLSRQRRHEEAMDALYAALRLDPANHHIRFQLGLLQEELALYLDALLTYHSIRRGLEEQLKAGTDRRERQGLERLQLLARYRATILLGWGERLADQWLPAPQGLSHSKRIHELAEIRARLCPALVARYENLDVEPEDAKLLGVDKDIKETIEQLLAEEELPGGPPPQPRRRGARALPKAEADAQKRRIRKWHAERELRRARLVLLFQLCAYHDVKKFLAEYDDGQIRALDTEITPLALHLLPPWARIRAHKARVNMHTAPARHRKQSMPQTCTAEPPPEIPTRYVCETCGKDIRRPADDWSWPICVHAVKALWSGDRAGRDLVKALAKSEEFIDHYNAACTFAVALLRQPSSEPRPDDKVTRALAQAAVAELHVAVRVAASKQIAAQWDWIVKEDPDLAGLRGEPEFQDFERARFPSAELSRARPTDIVTLVAARHSALLLSESASRIEQRWHSRADGATSTDPHDALAWWSDEREAWKLACELARNDRHWQTRLDVIRYMQRLCDQQGLGEFWVAQPAYSDDPIRSESTLIDKAARHEIQQARERIEALPTLLDQYGHDRFERAWTEHLERLDKVGEPLDEGTARRLAVNRASAWGEIRIAFETRLGDDAQMRAAKRALVSAAGKLAELPAPLPGSLAAACGRRRLLVVANRTLYGPRLRDELQLRARKGAELHFVAPIFGMRLRYDTRDVNREIDAARRRMRDALTWARENGIRATGTVGDPHAALGAVEDELERSGADGIIVSTLPSGRSNWLETEIVARLGESLPVPVEHLVVDSRVYVTVEHSDRSKEVRAAFKQSQWHVSKFTPDGRMWVAVDGIPLQAAEDAIRRMLDDRFEGSAEWISLELKAPQDDNAAIAAPPEPLTLYRRVAALASRAGENLPASIRIIVRPHTGSRNGRNHTVASGSR